MIYLYIGVIALVAFLIVLFFALNKDRRDKKIAQYKQQKLEEEKLKEEEIPEINEQEQKVAEAVEQGELESFSLGDEEEKTKEEETEEETEEDDSARKTFEDSFAEYEKFLKENNINLDDLDDDEEESKEEDSSNTKTINTKDFEGKSREEIIEMLSEYTPEEQAIILDELIGKKEED